VSDRAQTPIWPHHSPESVASGPWLGSKSPGQAAESTDRERAGRNHRPNCAAKCQRKATCATRCIKPLRWAKKSYVSSTDEGYWSFDWAAGRGPAGGAGDLVFGFEFSVLSFRFSVWGAVRGFAWGIAVLGFVGGAASGCQFSVASWDTPFPSRLRVFA
jgi:hypothetical protein